MDSEQEKPATERSRPLPLRLGSPLAATAFLTRIPVPRRGNYTLDEVARAQLWFPAVGLLIGAVLLAVDRVANRALPDPSVDVIVVVTLIVITGALHLDGLADAADGLFGAHTPERRLAIMHDVHAGTYAIVAIVSVLALKWAGLIATPSSVRVEALLLVPCVARFAMVLAIGLYPYPRGAGMGDGFRQHAWPLGVAIGGATALAAAVVLLGGGGILVFLCGGACAIAFGLFCQRLVGGLTGDLYGATVEITEAATFLFLAAMANRGWIEAWILS
jgi:adenosylcobinamide-GDP ribazoletransferase